MPPRAVREVSVAVAVTRAPRGAGARNSMLAPAATIGSPCKLQANAKALSASVKRTPPWQIPWPLTMSARTVMATRTHPGATSSNSMPSARDAVSFAYSASAAVRALRRASAVASSCDVFTRSSPKKIRRPFAGEGRDTFRIVRGPPKFALHVPLDIELCRERMSPAIADRGLGRRETSSRCDGKLLRERLHRRLQFGIIDALPYHPPGRRLLGRQLVAKQCQTERPRVAHQPGQDPRTAGIRHQAELRKRLHETRRTRRNDQIASQRNIGPGPRRDAVDRGDDRDGKGRERQYQRLVVPVDGLTEIDPLIAGRDRPIAQILPGAETTSRACEHQHSRTRCGQALQGLSHFGVHDHIETVEFVRAVQCQPRDARVDAEQNGFV